MKNEPLHNLLVAAGLAALVIAFVSSARAADGKDVTRTATYTTSQGGSGSSSSVTTRAQGVVTREGSWMNAAGGKGSWQSQTTWDKDAKTGTINGSATTPNGATTSWQATETRTGPGIFSEKGTVTRSNGKQSTFVATRTRVAPGSWDKQETITTADGKTINRTVDTSVGDGKGTRTVTTTLPDGKTVTNSATFTQSVAPAQAPAS